MQCPKCESELKRFMTMRSQKLACPNCKARLEPAPRRAPLLMFLLCLLPVQMSTLFRLNQYRPGPLVLIMLACGYLAAWIAVVVLGIREARRPALQERKRPEPEIVLNLNGPLNPHTPR
jgi:hypothetical protein